MELIPHWFQVAGLIAMLAVVLPTTVKVAKAEIIANHKEIRNATDR